MPDNSQHVDHHQHHQTSSEFQFSDYFMMQDYYSFDQDAHLASQNTVDQYQQNVASNITVESNHPSATASNMKQKSGITKKRAVDMGRKVAFRTKSKLDVMDDGYKWRKYGKKMVKNSPNPRNYFKCSSGGCHVKKRVERDRDDPSYVITTYEGVHNHESPCVVYHLPPMMPMGGFSLQESYTPSSSS
ncbi:uncharacterized protein [Coffea arabica]